MCNTEFNMQLQHNSPWEACHGQILLNTGHKHYKRKPQTLIILINEVENFYILFSKTISRITALFPQLRPLFRLTVKHADKLDFPVCKKYLVRLSKKGGLFRKCLFILVSFLVASFLLSNSKQVSVFIVQAASDATKEQKQSLSVSKLCCERMFVREARTAQKAVTTER